MLTEAFRVVSAPVTSNGQTQPFPCGNFTQLEIDINVTALRATSITFTYSRLDPFGNAFQVVSQPVNVPGTVLLDIGPGLSTNKQPGQTGQLSWVIAGPTLTTTVTVGANSSTQNVGSTANMVVGDNLYFVTAAVNATVVSITDATHVVLSAAVNSTTGETVQIVNTPTATFSALGEGK